MTEPPSHDNREKGTNMLTKLIVSSLYAGGTIEKLMACVGMKTPQFAFSVGSKSFKRRRTTREFSAEREYQGKLQDVHGAASA